MSAASQAPRKAPAPLLRLLPDVADRDFLPPAMGLVETPQSPIRTALMLSICGLTGAALLWSWFGRIDVLAVARGSIVPVGYVKVVQPAETGRITALRVADGQSVKAGEVLLQLETREAEADLDGAAKAETAARAEAERRRAALVMARGTCWTCATPIAWSDEVSPAMRARESDVLRGDMKEIAATIENLDDQEAEKRSAVAQAERNMEAQQHLLDTLDERVDMRKELMSKLVGSRSGVIDATQSLREAQTRLVDERGRRDLALADLASVRSQRERTVQAFVADQTRKMADALRLAEDKHWTQVKAKARLDHLTLRAPVDGVVQNLTVTTLGQVVSQGQEVLRIVPAAKRYDVQAFVPNDDIGFVRAGQTATVKVDAFPFTRYGTIAAEVRHVSEDAIPSSAADEALADRSRAGDRSSQSLIPTAKPATNLVFTTVLALDATDIDGNGGRHPLRPGMTVSVEIKTGSRRILDYLLSPLTEVASGAMHER